MSKAFIKESDEEEDRPEEPSALPVGFKNYMTPQGYRQLQEELRRLLRVERPKVVDVVSWAAGNGSIDRKMATTSMENVVCTRLTGEYAFFPNGWRSPRSSTQGSRKTWTRCSLARPSPTLTSGEERERSPSLA